MDLKELIAIVMLLMGISSMVLSVSFKLDNIEQKISTLQCNQPK